LIENFVAGTTARATASLCGERRKTAAFFFRRIRELIARELEAGEEALWHYACHRVNAVRVRVFVAAMPKAEQRAAQILDGSIDLPAPFLEILIFVRDDRLHDQVGRVNEGVSDRQPDLSLDEKKVSDVIADLIDLVPGTASIRAVCFWIFAIEDQALTCPAFFVPGDLRDFAWTEGARDGETRI